MVQWLAWKFRKLPLQAAICQLNLPEHKRKGPRQPLGLLAKMRQTPGGGPSAEGLRASAEPRQVSRAELSKAITRPGANSSPQRMREWDTFLGTREGEADRTGRKAEPTDLSLGSGSWWKPQGAACACLPRPVQALWTAGTQSQKAALVSKEPPGCGRDLGRGWEEPPQGQDSTGSSSARGACGRLSKSLEPQRERADLRLTAGSVLPTAPEGHAVLIKGVSQQRPQEKARAWTRLPWSTQKHAVGSKGFREQTEAAVAGAHPCQPARGLWKTSRAHRCSSLSRLPGDGGAASRTELIRLRQRPGKRAKKNHRPASGPGPRGREPGGGGAENTHFPPETQTKVLRPTLRCCCCCCRPPAPGPCLRAPDGAAGLSLGLGPGERVPAAP